MIRKVSFEYDPKHIPKLKDEIEVMMMQIRDEAYQKGIVAERERIIKIVEDNFGNQTSDIIIDLIKREQK
jgi:hypothetical protein